MTRRWHFWLILAVIVIGLVIIFWPAPVTEEPLSEPAEDAVVPAAEATRPKTLAPTGAPKAVTSSAAADGSVLTAQAKNAWYSGDISGAMTLFEQAIDEHPDDPEPLTNYGRLLTLMVSYEKALPMLERARDLQPDNAQAWLDLATLYERVQQLDKSWAAQAEAAKLVGSEAVTRDEQGRFVVQGSSLW
jgi:Flp pilus assembly protein TadD